MNFDSLLSDVVATIIGGIVLTALFFLVREKIFSLPDIAGRWYLEMRTTDSAYNPYNDMALRYVAILWCEGPRVEGTVEKIYEDSTSGERQFIGANRTRGAARGYLEKKYFSKDKFLLHVVENGHGRESTNYYELIVLSNRKMKGKFRSMVADQSGTVRWQRNYF